MIKSYVLSPIKVTSQPQRLLNLQTLLPQFPEENNINQYACKRISNFVVIVNRRIDFSK